MEAVRAFNNELSSLYETRPPVSRAKMASVTKHAIKAIKFYKHVVQSVEKFVQKCKPEYKVPGLYVIDSIVRQSRHQFGSEKDVFGPRFTKNIVSTFQSLFKCPQEEKSRVIRVLNLWQKNAVFPVEVIQPLLDLAAEPNNVDLVLAAQRAVEKVVSSHQRIAAKSSNGGTEESLITQQSDIVNTVTKLLQQTGEGSLLAAGQESQLQQLQLLQQQLMMQTEMMSSKAQQTAPVLDNNLLAQIKLLTDQLLSKTSDSPPATSGHPFGSQNSAAAGGGGGPGDGNMASSNKRPEPGFNRKLLDFDYGDSDEEEDRKDDSNVPGLPGGVHKLLSDPTIMQHIHHVSSTLQKSEAMSSQELLRKQHLEQQQEQFNKEIGQGSYKGAGLLGSQQDVIVVEDQDDERDRERDYDRDRRRSRRSRDRSRSPRRRRHSRSRSRERRRSRDRHRRSRSREYDRERREKDRERKKKGLPPMKDKCISVCTRTLWFGHLAKHTTEEELRSEIGKYGTIETINMVPPRGCAFVCMAKRKEAAKALDRMKGFKLNSSALRVAWAPGIGVKESNFRDQWDVELGVTYIPWNKLPADISPLMEGAIIDEDSLPEHLKGSLIGQQNQDEDMDNRIMQSQDSHNPQMMNPMHNFGGPPGPGMPPGQQMPMIPPPMMMTIPGQPAPNPQVPPMPGGQIPLPGHLQPSSAPPGMPPSLMPPQMSTPMSLPGGVSLPQAVSTGTSLLGAPPNMLNAVTTGASMDGLGAAGLGASSSTPLLPPGQQPGLLARPGFPPPGAPFGLPPNMPPRPGLPLPGQGLRLPGFPGQEREIEEPKEWPADDKILEEEALAEMDEDVDHRMGMGGDAGKGPAPLMSLPMMGMRLPGPGGPRMPIQVAGGAPRPGMMLEVNRAEAGAGLGSLPMGPGGAFSPSVGRPGLLGPRVMRPGLPQEGAEGVMRSPLPGGIMGAQGGPAMGLRLGVGAQGPSNLQLGQRMPGMPGSPGLRGLGGQGPIRILLGNQSPRGPGGLGVRPGGLPMGEVATSLGQGPRGGMEDGQGPLAGMAGPNPGQGNQPPGLLQNLMMGAALRGGRPGLLGLRPNMPVNGGLRFGPQPGSMNFGGPRPDFLRMPGGDKSHLDGPFGGLPGEDGDKSPEYGEGFVDNDMAADMDLRGGGGGRPGVDLAGDMPGMTKPRDRAGRQSRWSDVEKSDSMVADGPLAESNGPSSEISGLGNTEDNQSRNVLEGASEG